LKKAIAKNSVDGEPFFPTVPLLLTSQLGEIDIHPAFFPPPRAYLAYGI